MPIYRLVLKSDAVTPESAAQFVLDDTRNTRSQESRRRDIEGSVTQPVLRGDRCPGFQEKPSNPELCWETPPLAKFQ